MFRADFAFILKLVTPSPLPNLQSKRACRPNSNWCSKEKLCRWSANVNWKKVRTAPKSHDISKRQADKFLLILSSATNRASPPTPMEQTSQRSHESLRISRWRSRSQLRRAAIRTSSTRVRARWCCTTSSETWCCLHKTVVNTWELLKSRGCVFTATGPQQRWATNKNCLLRHRRTDVRASVAFRSESRKGRHINRVLIREKAHRSSWTQRGVLRDDRLLPTRQTTQHHTQHVYHTQHAYQHIQHTTRYVTNARHVCMASRKRPDGKTTPKSESHYGIVCIAAAAKHKN